jgi:solute:Na+ symporter, SSS family
LRQPAHDCRIKHNGGPMFEGSASAVQIGIFIGLTALIALLTYRKVHGATAGHSENTGTTREVFLAGGGLTWLFVAGSITLTNLSTEQLVGMNGNQMLLLAWWEICGFFGLLILAFVFVPIYYRNNCKAAASVRSSRRCSCSATSSSICPLRCTAAACS